MDWETKLEIMLDALGAYPTHRQMQSLEGWILLNVPAKYWSAVSWNLPSDLQSDLRMRAAESGY